MRWSWSSGQQLLDAAPTAYACSLINGAAAVPSSALLLHELSTRAAAASTRALLAALKAEAQCMAAARLGMDFLPWLTALESCSDAVPFRTAHPLSPLSPYLWTLISHDLLCNR